MKKTLGGDRLGSGKKMEVDLHNYGRSTHDMSYIWRSTMAPGTLVPFLCEVALPGDTFDINLDVSVLTNPTVGPLFGQYKVQLDVFEAPIRLYNAMLHNNMLGIGMKMQNVFLPQMTLYAQPLVEDQLGPDPDNAQVNPSCILSYLNIRGIGIPESGAVTPAGRQFNAVPYLAYCEIFKNYYANKQETEAYVINTETAAPVHTVTEIQINLEGTEVTIPATPSLQNISVGGINEITVDYTGAVPIPAQIYIYSNIGKTTLNDVAQFIGDTGTSLNFYLNSAATNIQTIYNWGYVANNTGIITAPTLKSFPLADIDTMREKILSAPFTSPFDVTAQTELSPYNLLLGGGDDTTTYTPTQQGLLVKTYQSDLLNNWLNTEWIDGTNGISEVTAIDTSSGSFTLDTLNLSKKVYDMLNRIAVSGGSYNDWLDAIYVTERYMQAESPIYHGSLIKDVIFNAVVSNAAAVGSNTGAQPLGTLAGRGVLGKKHKGGQIEIKVHEPSYIIGIVSITPRIDYSQGNKWDTHLETMDDLHKPVLDQIGFQELITEQMAWFDTARDATTGKWIQKSAGKQPAWLNYMTNINQVRGNFAIQTNEMFMTLNRRYEWGGVGVGITDITTYIDPVLYNQIFAQTSIDAQNFWTQIAINMEVRRKMSAKLMPNV